MPPTALTTKEVTALAKRKFPDFKDLVQALSDRDQFSRLVNDEDKDFDDDDDFDDEGDENIEDDTSFDEDDDGDGSVDGDDAVWNDD